jgi:hypothetical protein
MNEKALIEIFAGMASLVCLYPVSIATRDGKLRYACLRFVERKWGTSRYSGRMKWRYRIPTRSRSR